VEEAVIDIVACIRDGDRQVVEEAVIHIVACIRKLVEETAIHFVACIRKLVEEGSQLHVATHIRSYYHGLFLSHL
jgi:hypothetical protein